MAMGQSPTMSSRYDELWCHADSKRSDSQNAPYLQWLILLLAQLVSQSSCGSILAYCSCQVITVNRTLKTPLRVQYGILRDSNALLSPLKM